MLSIFQGVWSRLDLRVTFVCIILAGDLLQLPLIALCSDVSSHLSLDYSLADPSFISKPQRASSMPYLANLACTTGCLGRSNCATAGDYFPSAIDIAGFRAFGGANTSNFQLDSFRNYSTTELSIVGVILTSLEFLNTTGKNAWAPTGVSTA